jgi:hypothetical protein
MIPEGTPSKPVENYVATTVHFVGEQDGPPERELKEHLATLLKLEKAVHRAYLARVRYNNRENYDVALCLRATNPDAKQINDRVGRVFAGIFRRDAYLDVLFLSEKQESELLDVCPAFYHEATLTNG